MRLVWLGSLASGPRAKSDNNFLKICEIGQGVGLTGVILLRTFFLDGKVINLGLKKWHFILFVYCKSQTFKWQTKVRSAETKWTLFAFATGHTENVTATYFGVHSFTRHLY